MDENTIYEYLIQMGAMQPEQDQMKRRQAMVDALRKQSMEGPQGQMVSGRFVAPSITQYAAQLGNAYMANKGQQAVDRGYSNPDFNKEMPVGPSNMPGLNQRQQIMLERLRRKRQGDVPVAYGAPDYSDDLTPETVRGRSF